ncbi:hypothetical protein MERGE_001709 [Pneumocystis wakefieldiae]|uniref:TOG domain-containing protein n=1 Tax=Pneumocystis wakefieldiae TaxID=38082 RepID=A0A899FZ50_9ASCO|nr:hypothetical protein MERGE_001709 [Pneumocystis wakefieldiae]
MSFIQKETALALTSLLSSLKHTDNEIRMKAEASLHEQWIAHEPEILLVGLAEQVNISEDSSLRSFAVILLRRISFKPISLVNDAKETMVWNMLSQEGAKKVQSLLLESFTKENDENVRHKIADTISEVAHTLYEENVEWPELLYILSQCTKSMNPGQRESTFRIIASIPEILKKEDINMIKQVFQLSLQDDNVKVQLSSLKALSSLFTSSDSDSHELVSLLPLMLNVFPPLLQSNDGDSFTSALTSLIELAEIYPKIFKPYFGTVVQFFVESLKNKNLGNSARQSSLEFLVTFSESAPGMCRKDENYPKSVIYECLSFMTEVGMEEGDKLDEWLETDDLDFSESELNHIVGEQAMDRLARKLGGKVLLPIAFQWLPSLISSQNWNQRHASLMAISAIAEGCEKIMKAELGQVLDMVLPLLKDTHPRVRWAACNTIGQMSTDFAKTMQKKFHKQVLSALIPVLEAPEPRLLYLLKNQKRYVQEQAITTIATVADAAEKKFIKYYDSIMPLLINILNQAKQKEYKLLRGKAIECVTLIAIAVGKEKFSSNSNEIIQTLGLIQSTITEPDDLQSSYLIAAWGRICKVMGKDFIPYMGAIMPPLLHSAKLKPDFTVLDDDDNHDKYLQEEGWEFISVQGQQIGIKTSALEEKCIAIEMLLCYAIELKAAFEPYVEEILTDIVIPGLRFYFHDGVRSASTKAVPQLLSCIKEAHGENNSKLMSIWSILLDKIINLINTESAIDVLTELYQCLYESIDVVGNNCLSSEKMDAFMTSSESQLQDYIKRVQKRYHDHQTDEANLEDEDVASAIVLDDDLLSEMSKTFHIIFKRHRLSFLPHWERLLPYLDEFVNNQHDANARQWAICVMDDLIEFTGPDAWKYKDHFLKPLSNGIIDDAPGVRQAAAYGIGVAGQYGGEPFSMVCSASLPHLFRCFERPDSRSEDHIYATENICCAIAKILRFNSSKISEIDKAIELWIKTLPVTHDEEDAPYAYAFLVELIERNHAAVLSQPALVMDAIAQALESEILQGHILDRILNSSKVFCRKLSQEQINMIISNMPLERQQVMASYFS